MPRHILQETKDTIVSGICKLFSEFQNLKRDKWKEKMLGWCQAIARNPHRFPNSTRTPEVTGDASHISALVSGSSIS